MADRDLSAGMLAAITAGTVRPAILFEGVFDNGGVDESVYLWSGVGNLSWDGKTWLGGGNLLSFSPIEETGEVRAVGFQVSLSGMSQTMVSLFQQSLRSGRRGKLWLALFRADLHSLDFNGSSQKALSDANVDFPESLSIEYWFRPDAPTTQRAIVSNRQGGGHYIGHEPGGKLFWYVNASSVPTMIGIASLVAGTTYHAAFTTDGTTSKMYLNGALDQTQVRTSPASSGRKFDVAHDADNADWYGGGVDEVRFYSRALSPDEVAQHRAGIFNDESGLILRWSFDEGSGSAVSDLSGNGRVGTLTGSPVWNSPMGANAAPELIADPYPLRRGRLDVGITEDDGDKAILTAKYEDRLRDLERPREQRWTSEDQILLVPGDTGFDNVPALQDAVFTW
jgi:hypothetical protein